jgi:hypothetical protein
MREILEKDFTPYSVSREEFVWSVADPTACSSQSTLTSCVCAASYRIRRHSATRPGQTYSVIRLPHEVILTLSDRRFTNGTRLFNSPTEKPR